MTIEPAIFSPDNDGFEDVLTVAYRFEQAGFVGSMSVFDIAGRLVTRVTRDGLIAGEQQIPVVGREWAAGVYHYRLRALDPNSGAELASASGRMLRLR